MSTKHLLKGVNGREVELTVKQIKAHAECIEHWLQGGDVEMEVNCSDGIFRLIENPKWSIGNLFRIAKREPKPGEVWEIDGCAALVMPQSISAREPGDFVAVGLNEHAVWHFWAGRADLKHLADSLADYYAAKQPKVSKLAACALLREWGIGLHGADPLADEFDEFRKRAREHLADWTTDAWFSLLPPPAEPGRTCVFEQLAARALQLLERAS